jgi:cell division protein FtsZ
MKNSVRIFQIKQEITEKDLSMLSTMESDDICFFRFVGGNVGETKGLIEQLSSLKEKRILLFGIFRFPFRFEGKKRLHTAVAQYHQMKEICDAVTYFHSDGMMDILEPGTTIKEANLTFDSLEESPIVALSEMIHVPGEMNIDVQDIQTLIKNKKGPLFIRTFEGDSFDEPLKYSISAPYLPQDYADGEQMIINIGYSQDVDMGAFRQINLRLNDLFHKADLFKIGTYFIDEPGHRFKITLVVSGILDPYPRPEKMKRMSLERHWFKRKWDKLFRKGQNSKWLAPMLKR